MYIHYQKADNLLEEYCVQEHEYRQPLTVVDASLNLYREKAMSYYLQLNPNLFYITRFLYKRTKDVDILYKPI